LSLATALGRAKGSSTWALGVYHDSPCDHRRSVLHSHLGFRGGGPCRRPSEERSAREERQMTERGGLRLACLALALVPRCPARVPASRVRSPHGGAIGINPLG